VTERRSRVVNVVATANLGQEIDLDRVGLVVGGRYDPESYHCAYLKAPPIRGRVIIFASGKMIGVGTKTLAEARDDLGFAARILNREGISRSSTLTVTIQNIVTTFDLDEVLDLVGLNAELEESVYDPEVFPGLAWKPGDFPAHLLIFGSGKVVASVKTMKDAARVTKYLESRVFHHHSSRSA